MSIDSAYSKAIEFANSHYENFPVVSFLIPKELRKDVAVIYWFARTADDFADEGNFSKEERLEKLNRFEFRLTELLKGNFENQFEEALANTIEKRNLSSKYFFDLLSAFKQDVTKQSYSDFNEVLNYCERSANPVGRLILELFDIQDQEAFKYSDKICTALQLTNFWQDVSVDLKKDRIYLPQDEMEKFAVHHKLLVRNENNLKLKQLIKFQVERTRKFFDDGEKIMNFLTGRLKLEIKWTILGGRKILRKIEKQDYEVLGKRPKLNKMDYFLILIKVFIS